MDIAKVVKDTIEGAIWPHERSPRLEIPFGEVIEWKEGNATIVFHGTSIIQDGFAVYEGRYGKWVIALAPRLGGVANIQRKPCTRTSGKARQLMSSKEMVSGIDV